jgi:hypothetical protein
LFAADQSAREIVHHVGDEGARDGCFEFTLCAVVDERTRSFECSTRVGQVVGERLLSFWSAGFGQSLNGASQKCGYAFDDGGGSGEVFGGVVHEIQR